jgi:VanZ family protein
MKFKVLAILWMVLIFISSSIPSDVFPDVGFWGWSKLVHLIYFGVLCYLLEKVLREQRRFPLLARRPVLFAFIFTVIYGITDEVHQLITPGRNGQPADVLIDALGASLSIAGTRVYAAIRRKDIEPAPGDQ